MDIFIVKDPNVAKLFADETRRQILHSLRHHELSATDLAKILNKSHSSIIHHLKLLKVAGLVEETRVEQKRNLVQVYYRSAANKFLISYSLSDSLEVPELLAWQKEIHHKIVAELEAFGISVPDSEKDRIRRLLRACYLREQKAFEEAIEQQVKPIEFEKPVYKAIIRLLAKIKLAKDDEHTRIIDELGRSLKTQREIVVGE